MKNKCKICGKEILKHRIYCSNACKFSDDEYNKSRSIKKENDGSNEMRCTICGWQTLDIYNYGGHLATHLRKKHDILDKNYNLYYNKISVPLKDVFKCPYCDWKTNDIINKSGAFTKHLINEHKKNIFDYIKEYPDHDKLFVKYVKKTNYDEFIADDARNGIKCEVCGKYFKKISNSHLKHHNMSPQEYKDKYNIVKTTSNTTSLIQSTKTKKHNARMMKYYQDNNIPMPWHSSEVYTKKVQSKFEDYKTKLGDEFTICFDYNTYWHGSVFQFICVKCGNSFDSGYRYPRCYVCNPPSSGVSDEEKELQKYIRDDLKINIECNNRKLVKRTEVDIYIPSMNIGIEYDGLYYHSELSGKKDKNYHIEKTFKLSNCGVKLIHITSDEWLNKQTIVKNRIKHMLGVTDSSIHARLCDIKEIDSKLKNNFLNNNHIQGGDNSSIKIGAFYNNELVAVMTFGSLRRALGSEKKDNEYEMVRFCLSDHKITGIFGRLLGYFVNNYNPLKIITYSDIRWSPDKLNNVYVKNNFKLISQTPPNYWYMSGYKSRLHRFNFTKHRIVEKHGGDPTLSEWQNMQLMGYDRIWDCGSYKYEFIV